MADTMSLSDLMEADRFELAFEEFLSELHGPRDRRGYCGTVTNTTKAFCKVMKLILADYVRKPVKEKGRFKAFWHKHVDGEEVLTCGQGIVNTLWPSDGGGVHIGCLSFMNPDLIMKGDDRRAVAVSTTKDILRSALASLEAMDE